MNPPQISIYRGYDPSSRTLRPLWTTGGVSSRYTPEGDHKVHLNAGQDACMGPSMPPGILQWFDTAVTPRAGDYVLLYQRNGSGVEAICKKLLEIDGELWACCHFFIVPVAWLQNVVAVATLVCEVRFPGAHFTHIKHQLRGSDDEEAVWRAQLNGHPKVQRAITALRASLMGTRVN